MESIFAWMEYQNDTLCGNNYPLLTCTSWYTVFETITVSLVVEVIQYIRKLLSLRFFKYESWSDISNERILEKPEQLKSKILGEQRGQAA